MAERTSPTLVILRGNSGSGKSTVARRVQRSLPRGEVAVIGQDVVRRDMLWELDEPGPQTPGLLRAMARHCLDLGRHTILEGILDAERYGETLRGLCAEHEARGGWRLVVYLDVGLPETLRRHASKPLAAEVGEDEVASWYRERDLLGTPGELVLGEEHSEDALVERLLAELPSR
ncbi:AAA family ATPase [Brachybacterium squillarum]|uniref:AAA family ATPase n=1 Tax=Brachybacterium squillarum TaxID=661979 RepID=UPI000525A3DE|nr:AAA family ATPase [Brachybacterium squillarum]